MHTLENSIITFTHKNVALRYIAIWSTECQFYNLSSSEFSFLLCHQTYAHIEVMRWVLVCVIGVMTGFVAFVIVAIVRTLVSFKYGLVIKG